MMDIENNPTNNANKTKSGNNMLEIFELILKFNQLNQEGRLENFNNELNAQYITNFFSPIKSRK